jgi:hypothetical protein
MTIARPDKIAPPSGQTPSNGGLPLEEFSAPDMVSGVFLYLSEKPGRDCLLIRVAPGPMGFYSPAVPGIFFARNETKTS